MHRHPRFVFTLQVCPSQRRDVLLLRYRLEGDAALRPYALLAARLGGDAQTTSRRSPATTAAPCYGRSRGRSGWRCRRSTATAPTPGDAARSAASRRSDGWQDFNRNGRMTWRYDAAGPGAVALMGELPAQGDAGARPRHQQGGGGDARGVGSDGGFFDVVWDEQCRAWTDWLSKSRRPALREDIDRALALSATVLKVHQDRTYCGAAVASLSVAVGRQQPEPRRLSSGLVARSGGDRGRAGRHGGL